METLFYLVLFVMFITAITSFLSVNKYWQEKDITEEIFRMEKKIEKEKRLKETKISLIAAAEKVADVGFKYPHKGEVEFPINGTLPDWAGGEAKKVHLNLSSPKGLEKEKDAAFTRIKADLISVLIELGDYKGIKTFALGEDGFFWNPIKIKRNYYARQTHQLETLLDGFEKKEEIMEVISRIR